MLLLEGGAELAAVASATAGMALVTGDSRRDRRVTVEAGLLPVECLRRLLHQRLRTRRIGLLDFLQLPLLAVHLLAAQMTVQGGCAANRLRRCAPATHWEARVLQLLRMGGRAVAGLLRRDHVRQSSVPGCIPRRRELAGDLRGHRRRSTGVRQLAEGGRGSSRGRDRSHQKVLRDRVRVAGVLHRVAGVRRISERTRVGTKWMVMGMAGSHGSSTSQDRLVSQVLLVLDAHSLPLGCQCRLLQNQLTMVVLLHFLMLLRVQWLLRLLMVVMRLVLVLVMLTGGRGSLPQLLPRLAMDRSLLVDVFGKVLLLGEGVQLWNVSTGSPWLRLQRHVLRLLLWKIMRWLLWLGLGQLLRLLALVGVGGVLGVEVVLLGRGTTSGMGL